MINLNKNLALRICFILIFIFSFIFASWYVSHGDIVFQTDSARDFNLLRQVDEKKIVLIGPRSSGNLYHGPLWLYVNYPAYAISQGNPLVVGWNWVLLWALFTAICFFVSLRLFGEKSALIFTSWATLFAAFYTNYMINSHGAMVFMPLLIYFFVKYLNTLKAKFLLFFLLVLGAVTQFEIALGIPLIILSLPVIFFITFKNSKKRHLLALTALFLMLSNFLIFDVKHNFLLFHNLLKFLSPHAGAHVFNYSSLILDRISYAFTSVSFLTTNIGQANCLLLLGLLVMVCLQIRANRFRTFYLSILYFYFGFFILSFIDKGPILYFYVFPLSSIIVLAASSLINTHLKPLILILFLLIIVLNLQSAIKNMQTSFNFIGKDKYSWQFLDNMSKKIFQGKESSFGYFVYAPDAFAYSEKYAMYYESRKSTKISKYFVKMPVTYVIAEPPPSNNPYMKSEWWIKNQINIAATPSSILTFPNGYQILKYNLTEAETKVSFDSSVDPGINFR
jgi:hypothetical protein